jgi:hypothetical protein
MLARGIKHEVAGLGRLPRGLLPPAHGIERHPLRTMTKLPLQASAQAYRPAWRLGATEFIALLYGEVEVTASVESAARRECRADHHARGSEEQVQGGQLLGPVTSQRGVHLVVDHATARPRQIFGGRPYEGPCANLRGPATSGVDNEHRRGYLRRWPSRGPLAGSHSNGRAIAEVREAPRDVARARQIVRDDAVTHAVIIGPGSCCHRHRDKASLLPLKRRGVGPGFAVSWIFCPGGKPRHSEG